MSSPNLYLPTAGADKSIYVISSIKTAGVWGVRIPLWMHVQLLLVDRDERFALFYDLVSTRAPGRSNHRLARVRMNRTTWPGDVDASSLLAGAEAALPKGYQLIAAHRYDDMDLKPAIQWLEAQRAHRTPYRYRPFVAHDCFLFATEALRRAGAPLSPWQLYLLVGDGATKIPLVASRARKQDREAED